MLSDYGFTFLDNETKMIYYTEQHRVILDLETGDKKVDDDGFERLHGPFEFFDNNIITFDNQESRLTIGNSLGQEISTHRLQVDDKTNLSIQFININPYDHSTVAIADKSNKIFLLDISQLMGDKFDYLYDMDTPKDGEVIDLKFSPNGHKIAAVHNDIDKYDSFVAIYDLADRLRETAQHSLKGFTFTWYDDDHICFVDSGKIFCWNVNENNKTELCSAYHKGVYVHPTLPMVVNFRFSLGDYITSGEILFKLWMKLADLLRKIKSVITFNSDRIVH